MSSSDSKQPKTPQRNHDTDNRSANRAIGQASTEFIWLVAFALIVVALAAVASFRGDSAADEIDYGEGFGQHRADLRAALISPDTLPTITVSWSMDWVIGGALLVFFGFLIFLTFLLLMHLRWRSAYTLHNKFVTIVILQGLKRLDPLYWFLVLGLYGCGGPYMIYRGFQVIRRGLNTPQQRRSNHLISFCLTIADQAGDLLALV